MFSITIPTFNNVDYLKLCIKSLNKNSFFKNQIIVHVNLGEDETLDFLKKEKIEFTYTDYNAGICKGVNLAAQKSKFDYIVYAHDDFYFCPNWDKFFFDEINIIGHKNFYLSGIMMNNGPIKFNCGENLTTFDENHFLNNYTKYNSYDFQGSTWAPHVIHKDLWSSVGGFSEEFFPGTGSDPDLNMKLWKKGVRIFKGLNSCKVYHFGSIVTRKYKNHPFITTESGSRGSKIFLLKWGLSINFFKKFILKSDTNYSGVLNEPKKNIKYIINLFFCKLNYVYLRFIYNYNNKHNLINK